MFLIHRSRSTSSCDHRSEWTLPLFAIWDPDPIRTSSDCEMNHDRRSIPAFSSSFPYFLPLSHFTIWKTNFSRACLLCEILWSHWSIFKLISTFHYGSHLTHSTHPTPAFFLASQIHENPFYLQSLSFWIMVINSWCPLPHSYCHLFQRQNATPQMPSVPLQTLRMPS